MADSPDASGIDYSAVLVDLEARRDALNVAIDSIRAIIAGGAQQAVSGPRPIPHPGRSALPEGIAPDAFFSMSIADAAKKYLTMMKQPRDTKDISDALDRGGLIHQSKDFQTTLYTTLIRREKSPGDFIRVKGKWALSEWYPGRRPVKQKEESE